MDLRKFDSMSSITQCFEFNTNPMMRVTAFGEISFFQTKAEKRNALTERKETEKFTIAWSGKWRTDVFEMTEKDILEVLK